MKYRISAFLLLSLMLSMLFMPLAVTADGGKSIIKEMVQTPGEYSVGNGLISPYTFLDLLGRGGLGYFDAYNRAFMYMPDWVFWRLPAPGSPG